MTSASLFQFGPTFSTFYNDNPSSSSFGPSVFAFDNVGSFGSMTGSLGVGSYSFVLTNEVRNGQGGSSVSDFLTLTLTRPENSGGGNGVPDTGSTVMLFGMALTALGAIRQKLAI